MVKTSRSSELAIILPAYNEASVIKQVIKGVQQVFNATRYSYKIIVVDDGSQDETAKIAVDAGAYVIKHIINTGTGGATATGLSYARKSNVKIAVTMDADGQHNPKDVLKGILKIEEQTADLLIGSRLTDKNGMTKIKLIGNRGLSFVTYLLFGVYVSDSQSGLRIFSEVALNKLRWKTSGYEFCSEMLWRAKQQNLRIDEFSIQSIYTDYSKSKGQNNWNAFNIIVALLQRRIREIVSE